MTLTVRELALEALVNVLGSIQQGSPSGDLYPIQFDFVQRNPLNEQAWQKRLTAGFHDTIEHVRDGQNNREYMLTVAMEFRRHTGRRRSRL
jgi:hypothetical protein